MAPNLLQTVCHCVTDILNSKKKTKWDQQAAIHSLCSLSSSLLVLLSSLFSSLPFRSPPLFSVLSHEARSSLTFRFRISQHAVSNPELYIENSQKTRYASVPWARITWCGCCDLPQLCWVAFVSFTHSWCGVTQEQRHPHTHIKAPTDATLKESVFRYDSSPSLSLPLPTFLSSSLSLSHSLHSLLSFRVSPRLLEPRTYLF